MYMMYWIKISAVSLVKLFRVITHKPYYNTAHYNTVLDIRQFKDGSQKMYRLYRKMTKNGHFSI